MRHLKKAFTYGRHEVVFETGEIARQADGAVLVSMGDNRVLVTVVGVKEVAQGQDFFPLTVDYQEKTYAAGRIPGGFFKREGKNSEKEILTARLIDRPLRPLFPDGFYNEVQIVATVMSADPEIDSDIPAVLGASAALAISGIPFLGPIGAARVGFKDGEFILSPTKSELVDSQLDLVVAGTQEGVLMVESEASELSEDIMLGAVVFGHQALQSAIQAILELKAEVNPTPWDWTPPAKNEELINQIKSIAEVGLKEAYSIREKQARRNKIDEAKQQVISQLVTETTESSVVTEINDYFHSLEAEIVRSKILAGEPRIDGRDTRTVRPITIRTDILPRAHGSVLFTRGETQALVIATLGTGRDEQTIDDLQGEYSERFMLHYNFPPYATGETGRMGAPKRREIGHGRLAKRALVSSVPEAKDFNYTIRIVSEITESNGSSSMASVCGGCLAMMDAGVPLKNHVAGIAMGLIKEDNRFAVLTDILGDEDHLGDMDFKVAGTVDGVTALQMDLKITSITKEIMRVALDQAKEGRLHILGLMKQALPQPRSELSENAPRILQMNINPDKIRDVIGRGGAVIRNMTEETGTTVDISEDGSVTIFGPNLASCETVKARIEEITSDIEVGKVYNGVVTELLDFGAVVTLQPFSKTGLLHISQISHERIANIRDRLKVGQAVRVKVIEADEKGRMKLSMKAVESNA